MSADTPSYDAFTSHQGPGFTLDLPAGWSVKHDERDLIMVEREGARLNIWPMLVHAPLGAHAAALLQAIAEQLRDDMTWNAPRRLADHVWTLDGEGQEAGFARLVLGASTPQGQPLWLYLATAPDAAHLAALTPLAERVFRSYRPRAPQDTEQGAGAEAPVPATSSAVSAAEAATGETPFVEPTEQAFAITVPTGWEAQAGVVRYGVSATPWIRLRAADGAEIRLFDPRLPTSHHEPGPATQFIGRAVGSVLNGVMVRPYTPPSAFAAEYATAMAQELGASGVTVTEHLGQEETVAAWSPAFRQAVEAEWARGIERLQRLIPHVQSQPDYGAVSFVCTGGPGDLAGLFYILGSRLTMPDGMGGTMYVWSAHPFGFIGPAVRRDALVRTLHEIGASKQMNPQWEQRQEHLARQQIQQQQQAMHAESMRTQQNIAAMRHQSNMNALRGAAQRSQIIANTYSEISDLSHQGFMNRMQSGDEMQRRGVNAIHGQYDVYNPSTGDITHGVPNHANHYWVDAFGNTIGTEIDENPDPFRFTRGQNLDNLYDTGGF